MPTRLVQKLLTALLLGLFSTAQAQQKPVSFQKEAHLLQQALEKKHYHPRSWDDQLSQQIFFHLLESLDPHHLYFNAEDMKGLLKSSKEIDNELTGASWTFLPSITTLYQQRLRKAEKTLDELLSKPINLHSNETASMGDLDSLDFALDEKDYLQRWNRRLKYEMLWQLAHADNDNQSINLEKLYAKEPAVRSKVQLMEKRTIKRMVEHPDGFENYVGTLFLQSITACFDPHSAYFSKTDWENFESALATEGFSLGIDLDESKTGNIVISRLVPGGPAWKSNELHKGDELTALKWAGRAEVDLNGAEVEEVENLIQSSNAERLEITVKQVSGQVKTVSLVKEKIRAEENLVKSFLLKGEKKIGYISLPGFYTDWETMPGMGCANDVAKEIIKLKSANIDGLILDIRFNGGGAMIEGLNLAGIFIDAGPLFVTRLRNSKPLVMKDMNRGTVYDGPLVLMVNGQSASASEIIASTLQDYNRAVIVGSATYGKATAQVITSLDSVHQTSGFSSITIEKLYRITGKSAQLKGVIPDVALPDIYENLNIRESALPFALPSDTIDKKIVYSPLKALPIQALANQSAARISGNPSFQTIKKLGEFQGRYLKEGKQNIPLTLAHFKKKALDGYQWWQALEKAQQQNTHSFSVENTNADKEVMKVDTYGKEVNDSSIKNIQEDIYLEEAYQIIRDLILLNKK